MEDEFNSIKAGITVDIKRTDGRVHAAMISSISRESVTVEWIEGTETKGKEIDLDSILSLNSHLISANYHHNDSTALPTSNKLSRNSTKASIPVMSNKGSYRSRCPPGRPTNIMSNNHSAIPDAPSAIAAPPTPVTSISSKVIPSGQHTFAQPAPPASAITNNIQQIQNATNQQNLTANKTSRVSNVVKEVEKLKKNREERRQRQAELKEEKEALMNLDPGNPNWEFLAMIREYQSTIEFRPLKDTDPIEDHQITVCVRKRPLNKKEFNRKEVDVITVPTKDQIVVHEPKNKVDLTKYLNNQLFRFDYAFNEDCTNDMVYKYSTKPLVKTVFEGGMATCFAYGETGSGKTHTMAGDFSGKTQDCKKGIYAMAAKDVFKLLRSSQYRSHNLVVSASFFEIYCGKVFDLLGDKAPLKVLEDGNQQVQIVGLTETVVDSEEEVLKIIKKGNTARISGQTSANSNSSRSHAVFEIILRNPISIKIHGKFSLIDLAGDERGAGTHSSDPQTITEGVEINKSLLALKECIRALGKKGSHPPFRNSTLTIVLRDSFIGNKSKTCMIAMISPGLSSCENSLNTLRYADRVKELAVTDPALDNKHFPSSEGSFTSVHGTANGNDSIIDDSDLAALRSLNDKETSAEMFTFHEGPSHLQELRYEVLDTLKALLDSELARRPGLFSRTRRDEDAYAQELQDFISKTISVWSKFGEKVKKIREQLTEEEK